MRRPRVYQFLLVAVVLFVPAVPAAAQIAVPLPPTLKNPPTGFDSNASGATIKKGTLKTYYYVSSVLSWGPIRIGGIVAPVSEVVWRPVNVYTPHDYNTSNQSYPVLYLLHGRMGTYEDWKKSGDAQAILDNLVDQKKMVPAIVVMPENYCSLQSDDSTETPSATINAGYELFRQELIHDLVPWVDANFATIPALLAADYPTMPFLGAGYRALAGLSMGAEQALNFGWKHQDTFGFIGAFSPGSSLVGGSDELIPIGSVPLESTSERIWVTCGNMDLVIFGSTVNHLPVYDSLETFEPIHKISTFNTLYGTHEWSVWKASLYYYAKTFTW